MRRPALALLLLPLLALAVPGHAAGGPAHLTVSTAFVFERAGGEPNVTVAPHGRTVLVDGLGGGSDPANLFRSTDSGRSFTQVRDYASDVGGGDWDMHFLSDKVVVAVDLAINYVNVDVSEDAGRTWRVTRLSGDPALDRPWVVGSGKDVYVTMKGFDGVPYLYASHDLGRTFSATPVLLYGVSTDPANPTPVDAFVTNQNAYVDSMGIDPRTGTVYVLYGIDGPTTYPSHPPLGAPNKLYVARYDKETVGPVLDSTAVYLGATDDAFYGGFNWLTVDAAGTVYVLGNGRHAGHQSAWLSSSKDHGRTWSPLVDVGTPKVSSVYAAIAPLRNGTLAMAYYEGTKGDADEVQSWYATLAVVDGAASAHPRVTHRQHVLAKPVHTKDICLDGILCGAPGFGDNRALLDYVDVAVGPDGSIWGAYASDGPATGGAGVATVLIRAGAPRR
jgi:hypothetical protein